MSGVNKVILVGRLGKDPEVRSLPNNGQMVATFSLATDESYKEKGTGVKKTKTEWHNIVIWGALANICQQYLHKGDLIYVEGKLRTRSWTKDNVQRYTTEVVVEQLTMLSTKKAVDGAKNTTGTGDVAPPPPTDSDIPADSGDDLPF